MVVELENDLVLHLDLRFATQWELLSLYTTLLFCSFSILNFNYFSFVRVICNFVESLSLFFQAWDASCLGLLSAWHYTWNVDGIKLRLDVGT